MKPIKKKPSLTLKSVKTRAAHEAEKQVEHFARGKSPAGAAPAGSGKERLDAQKQLEQILRVSPAVIYRCGRGPQYPVVYISDNCEKRLGFKLEEFLNHPHFWRNHVHPDDQAIVDRQVASIENGAPVTFEYRFLKPDGACVWLHDSITPSFDQTGNVRGFIGSCMNITERKLTEEALKKSEARFRELFEKAPDMYVVLNEDGYVIDLNERCANGLEQSRSTLEGTLLTDIVHLEDAEKISRLLRETLRDGGVSKTAEIRLVTGKNTALWVSAEFSCFQANGGQPRAVLLVCRDISKRKKMQRALARAQRLETAGRIAGQIAHDFNNLLAPLTAYPILIRDEASDNPRIVSLLDEMESASRQIAEINQQLLALGRRGHYRMEPIDLNELVEETLLLQQFPAGMTVKQQLAKDSSMIMGGGAQLTRVLINLMNNAIEATQGGGNITIKTELVRASDQSVHGDHSQMRAFVKLSVTDDGVGITPENLEKIYDPFFTTKKMDKVRGSGLGLSAVHGIVEDHGGFVQVESAVGAGAVFSLYFPALFDAAATAPAVEESIRGGAERVLVVDDDRTQRNVTSQLLAKLGYAVETVRSGEEAIQFCQKYEVDLLILDMIMEGIDGAETYRRILEFTPEQKAIIVSGYVTTNRVEEAMRMGVGQFVSKPVTFKTLANAVRKELDSGPYKRLKKS